MASERRNGEKVHHYTDSLTIFSIAPNTQFSPLLNAHRREVSKPLGYPLKSLVKFIFFLI